MEESTEDRSTRATKGQESLRWYENQALAQTLAFLMVAAVFLIVLIFIAFLFFDQSTIRVLDVVLGSVLTLGLLYLYNESGKVLESQAEQLERQVNQLESQTEQLERQVNQLERSNTARFQPRISVVDQYGREEIEINNMTGEGKKPSTKSNFYVVKLSNQGYGYAQNLQVEFEISYEGVSEDFRLDSYSIGLRSLSTPARYGMEEGAFIDARTIEEEFCANVFFQLAEDGDEIPLNFTRAIARLQENGVERVEIRFTVRWENAFGEPDYINMSGRKIDLYPGITFKDIMENGESIEPDT